MRRAAPLAVLVVAACEIEEVAIPQTEAQVAMHSVLSATAETQVVLLARTPHGSVYVIAPPFDIADPVVSDEGIAESDAYVQLTTPSGEILVAPEDAQPGTAKGRGVYRFALPGSALQPGGTYTLRVETERGEILTAETSVPGGEPASTAEQRPFDRSSDTVRLEWPAAPGARSYFVRIETPFGPRAFFTDSTRVRLTGDLRNVDTDGLPRVFIPGFPQAVTVSAVDSNYYDWFRSQNSAVSGTGLIDRVDGGWGVFGALVRLRFQELRVVAPQTRGIGGNYRFVGTALEQATTPFLSLELYVESESVRGDQADALSGRSQRRPVLGYPGPLISGLLGTERNGRVELAFLYAWSARDTTEIFTGEVRGDTIVGSYQLHGGIVRFVRDP